MYLITNRIYRFISHQHRDYDSICYPLYFIYGESTFEEKRFLLRPRQNARNLGRARSRTSSADQDSDSNSESNYESNGDEEHSRRRQRIDESTNNRRFGHSASVELFDQCHDTERRIRLRDIRGDRSEASTSMDAAIPSQNANNDDENDDEDDGLPNEIPEDVREHGRSEGSDIEQGSRNARKYQTASDHYSYRIMQRNNDSNILLKGRKLFQQFLCDMYIKIECIGMYWNRKNQDKLRAEEYDVYKDAINSGTTPAGIGKPVILPSSFTGGPRNQCQLYQDNMALVRKYGKPDLFITMTANPEWDEIKNNLLPNQKAEDRPDIVTRVFWLKFKELRNKIINGRLFGRVKCFVWVIEWQKVKSLSLMLNLPNDFLIERSASCPYFNYITSR